MRKGFFAVLLLVFCSVALAQHALNNNAVIKLAKAGLSDDVIVATINASQGSYDTTVDGLIALKNAGVSEKVIAALVLKSSGGAATADSARVTNPIGADPDDPAAPHEAGIYEYRETAPDHKMVMLEPSVYSQSKMGGVFASSMTYGIAKMKMKAVIRGAHSNTRVTDSQPVFYFYFEQQGAGLSNASSVFGGTSTPNEYTLLRFDVKKNTRETIVGKASIWGASGGVDDKATVTFSYTKLRPGVYKVVLSKPLEAGEYGFIAPTAAPVISPYGGGTAGVSRVFDFGFANTSGSYVPIRESILDSQMTTLNIY